MLRNLSSPETYFQAAFILMLSLMVFSYAGGAGVTVPGTVTQLSVTLLRELILGFFVAMVMRFFLYIPEQAGEVIDTQMGMSMARSYDPGSQSSMTSTANLLNALTIILFFSANGHVTLLRMMLTSGEIIPFGAASFGNMAVNRMVELFAECVLMSVKLSFPILGAELLGQVGMGVLMKAIPQINVFAINIELKVIIGMVMLLVLVAPMSEYLLEAESIMLGTVRDILILMTPGAG